MLLLKYFRKQLNKQKTNPRNSLGKILISLKDVKKASQILAILPHTQINTILLDLADKIPANIQPILAANQQDLSRLSSEDPKYDRLLLNEERLLDIADDIRKLADLESPLGKILEKRTLPNGLELSRVSVPLGVIGIIYEARPNVTFDVFSLCFKSGNAVVLKGGTDADGSNKASVKLIHKVLQDNQIDISVVMLLPPTREAVTELLEAIDEVDVIIPRGGKQLIDFVRSNAKVPVIETGAGIVHTYVDASVNIDLASSVINNAKTRRVSVCNALDTLIIHQGQLLNLPKLVAQLADKEVKLFADPQAYQVLKGHYPQNLLATAEEESFGVEFLSLTMAIKTVRNIDEAIEHISTHSSKHSEAILSDDPDNIEHFINKVAAAVVYSNASTAFTDGAQFGLGAEIGISTQKLHARGPMGLRELTSYKWIVRGSGQTRTVN